MLAYLLTQLLYIGARGSTSRARKAAQKLYSEQNINSLPYSQRSSAISNIPSSELSRYAEKYKTTKSKIMIQLKEFKRSSNPSMRSKGTAHQATESELAITDRLKGTTTQEKEVTQRVSRKLPLSQKSAEEFGIEEGTATVTRAGQVTIRDDKGRVVSRYKTSTKTARDYVSTPQADTTRQDMVKYLLQRGSEAGVAGGFSIDDESILPQSSMTGEDTKYYGISRYVLTSNLPIEKKGKSGKTYSQREKVFVEGGQIRAVLTPEGTFDWSWNVEKQRAKKKAERSQYARDVISATQIQEIPLKEQWELIDTSERGETRLERYTQKIARFKQYESNAMRNIGKIDQFLERSIKSSPAWLSPVGFGDIRQDTYAGRYGRSLGKSAITYPATAIVGIASAGAKFGLALEGLTFKETRSNVMVEAGRAISATPSAVASGFNPAKPEGLANLTIATAGVIMIGGARAKTQMLKPPKKLDFKASVYYKTKPKINIRPQNIKTNIPYIKEGLRTGKLSLVKSKLFDTYELVNARPSYATYSRIGMGWREFGVRTPSGWQYSTVSRTFIGRQYFFRTSISPSGSATTNVYDPSIIKPIFSTSYNVKPIIKMSEFKTQVKAESPVNMRGLRIDVKKIGQTGKAIEIRKTPYKYDIDAIQSVKYTRAVKTSQLQYYKEAEVTPFGKVTKTLLYYDKPYYKFVKGSTKPMTSSFTMKDGYRIEVVSPTSYTRQLTSIRTDFSGTITKRPSIIYSTFSKMMSGRKGQIYSPLVPKPINEVSVTTVPFPKVSLSSSSPVYMEFPSGVARSSYIPYSIYRSASVETTILNPRQVYKPIPISRPIIVPDTIADVGVVPKVVPYPISDTRNFTTGSRKILIPTPVPPPSPSPTPVPSNPNIPVNVPIFPPINLFPDPFKRKKTKKRKERFTPFNPRYVPSVEAQIFDIRGSRPSKFSVATGINIRPILKM